MLDILKTKSLSELQHIIGKRVCVQKNDGRKINGILQFVGYNEFFPSWGLHCTIDRMPGIQIDNISQIELI